VLRIAKSGEQVVVRLENSGGTVHEHGFAASQLVRLKEHGLKLVVAVDKVGGGGGYRDYFDFEFSPARDEFIWNANAELRKYFSEKLSGALVMNYDNFDSKNPLFAAERFITGCVIEMRF
jgi:hypothetical protein